MYLRLILLARRGAAEKMAWCSAVKTKLMGLLRIFLDLVFGFLFRMIYRTPGAKVPPIRNLLLLESATSLAYKIRTRKEINPVVNCVVDERFEAALADARAADKLVESKEKTEQELESELPFLGVPITTKDAIMVKADRDAETIALMRKAGAIPLAITNVSEVCMWWESHNKVYGRTSNPYDTNHIVGGSSGGEACLQASAASPMGIGSDIGASEAHNTYLGTGPMCRFAVDVKKLKIYYMDDNSGSPLTSKVHPEIKASMKKVITHFEKAYKLKAQKGNVNLWLEFPKWLLGLSNHTFIALATAVSDHLGVQPNSEKHRYLFELCDQLRQEFQDLLGDDGVFLYPTHPTPAPFHNEPIFKAFNFSYTAIFNVLGLPATACPLGLSSEGLPLGIQVIGALNQDHLTLAMAVELEKAFGGWVPPAIDV
ncbi:hypothetical protein B566_EDAN003786 [Ephemera danica]|nr:hypothetical protein B566_EDAN003786 [Ephemera danica]